jgi:hypothetical protein
VVSETVFDPSGFVMVVVCVVVKVPSGLSIFVTTSTGVVVGALVVFGMTVASTAIAGLSGSGLFCKKRVVQPATTHRMEAKMHIIPALPILQSAALLQISEAMAT